MQQHITANRNMTELLVHTSSSMEGRDRSRNTSRGLSSSSMCSVSPESKQQQKGIYLEHHCDDHDGVDGDCNDSDGDLDNIIIINTDPAGGDNESEQEEGPASIPLSAASTELIKALFSNTESTSGITCPRVSPATPPPINNGRQGHDESDDSDDVDSLEQDKNKQLSTTVSNSSSSPDTSYSSRHHNTDNQNQKNKLNDKYLKEISRTRTSLTRRIMDSAPNPTGLCVHPMSRTKEPYEVEVVTRGDASLDRRRRRLARAPLLSSMDPTSSKIIGRPSALTLKQKAASVGSTIAGSRSILQPRRMERFNYAKALLLSDDELERFAQKIRLEINESELFELAQAAERAAAAGETQFRGRASTFGGSTDHNFSYGDPLSLSNVDRPSSMTTEFRTPTKIDRSSTAAVLGDLVTFATPNRTRAESDPNGSVGAVNLSLPGTLKDNEGYSSLWPEPEKRSMEITALRNINEVIPRWKELHGHIRTHLYREKVNEKELFFAMDDASEDIYEQSACRFPTLPSLTRHSKSKSDVGQIFADDGLDGSYEISHRRSRSWIDDIADATLPALAQTFSDSGLDRSIVSFSDAAMAIASFDQTVTDVTDKDVKSKEQLNKSDQAISVAPLEVSRSQDGPDELEMTVPLMPIDSTLRDNDQTANPSSTEPSLPARLPKRKDVFELLEVPSSANRASDAYFHERRCSTCSSNDSFHQTKATAESADTHVSPVTRGEDETDKEEQKIIGAYSEEITSLSLFDADDESTCPASPLHEPSLETFIYQSYPPMTSENISIPQTPAMKKDKNAGHVRASSLFNTPAHLRVIKTLHRNIPNDDTPASPAEQSHPANRQRTSEVTTPSISFGPFEPNSIVANLPDDVPRIGRLAQRTRSPRFHDDETSYLALPTIQGTSPDRLHGHYGTSHAMPISAISHRKAFRVSRVPLNAQVEAARTKTPEVKDKEIVIQSLFESPMKTDESILILHSPIEEKKEWDHVDITSTTMATSAEPANFTNQQIDEFPLKMSYCASAGDIHKSNSIIIDNNSAALVRRRIDPDLRTIAGLESTTGVSESPVGRRWVSHGSATMCHSLPSPDKNIQAVIQGVISHFSPKKQKKRFGNKCFHSATENREYLNNYFYCSKRELEGAATANLTMDDDTQSGTQSYQVPPGQISWTDPCVGAQQCNIFGEDALCGGFTLLFPPPGHNLSVHEDVLNLHYTDEPPMQPASRLRSSSLAAVETRDNEVLRSPPPHGQKDKWFGIFRSFRLNFSTSESQTAKPKIPFSPPELARRLERTHSR